MLQIVRLQFLTTKVCLIHVCPERRRIEWERIGENALHTFFFVPWITYWVLCGAGSAYGIIITLMLSLFLMIPQMRARDINLMDALASFSSAMVGASFFGISAFVDNSGFLGYSVLFFMAMISLVIKRPYTPQVSKKDYPEAYWNDRTFLAVNNVITVAWAIIFLSNAILCLTARADSRWNSILGPVPSERISPFRCKERA
jgi:hypothetical protein